MKPAVNHFVAVTYPLGIKGAWNMSKLKIFSLTIYTSFIIHYYSRVFPSALVLVGLPYSQGNWASPIQTVIICNKGTILAGK